MKKLITLFFVLLMISAIFVAVASANEGESTTAKDLNLNITHEAAFKDPKMESAIAYMVKKSETSSAETENIVNVHDINFVSTKIRVVLELIDDKPSTVSSLKKYGIAIETTHNNLAQVLIPISEIKCIAEDPSIRYIRMPLKAHPSTITSEGVETIDADKLHDIAIKGDGVNIAIIDSGFMGYKANPEIPSANIIEARSFRADGDIEADEDHGTSCAEIVLDVAPDARLYLLNIETGVEFANAVDYAIEKDVDIISFSAGFMNSGGGDGTGFICDIANRAHENGILFINSAGNSADMHYEGTYNDTDGDNWHEFSINPKDEGLSLGHINAGDPISLYLSWNNWPYSDQDYDLYLFNESDIVAWSTNYQNGTQPPTEEIEINAPDSEDYYVAIEMYNATRDVHFELYSFDNEFPEYDVPSSSLSQPADAVGAMSVGATYWRNDKLEYFSSRGPTNDGRLKPDVTAPDGVTTLARGRGFFGTSASAPHTAGAAALLLSTNSSLTADDLQSLLESNAVDLGTPGKDNLYGSGRIDVWATCKGIPSNVKILSIDCPPQVVIGDVFGLTVTAKNIGKINVHGLKAKIFLPDALSTQENPTKIIGDGILTPNEIDSVNWTINADQSGTYDIIVEVISDNGGSGYGDHTIEVSEKCFIATAAYGTPSAKEIQVLRDFRDKVLMKNSFGRKFVALYYETSLPFAKFISEHDFAKVLTRELLVDPLVYIVRFIQ